MGSDILRLLAKGPHRVTVLNRSEEKAREREKKFLKGLEGSFKRGVISEDIFLERKEYVKFTHRWEDIASSDIVIETVVENYEEKAAVFHQLESVVKRDTVLVTNTSDISIEELAGGLKYQERFCGLHFFYPALLIDLIEIIKWGGTPLELVDFLKDFCLRFDKKAIVVMDGPGSVMNIILAYYYLEALYLLEEGLAFPSKIDELARQFYYLGPCESMDAIGIDFFIAAIGRVLAPGGFLPMHGESSSCFELPAMLAGAMEGFFVPYLFGKLLSQGRFGKHVSKGIYLYQKGKPVDDVPDLYINPLRAVPCENIGDEHIAKRLLYSIFNGSIGSLKRERGSLEELDLGVREVLQMQKGPFSMMRAIGEDKLKEDFDLLARTAGKRFGQKTFEFLNKMP
jgi:3-hydroxybutyryl-CoA dehydrogenase